jgi:hypothetical protein
MPMLLRGDFGYTMLADPISKALDPAFFLPAPASNPSGLE